MSLPSLSLKRRAGFSLVEVLLALGVVAAAVLALIGILGATFTSAREIALQHKALNAITQIDGAFQTAAGIQGFAPASATDPAFDKIYKELVRQGAHNGNDYVDLFVYQKTQEKAPAVPTVYLPSTKGQFLLTEAKGAQHEGIDTATVFRMRLRISPLLDKKLYLLDKTTYEVDTTKQPWAKGTALPTLPDDYGLAYLPLSIEVYPHNFSDETDPSKSPAIKPIMSQTVVINR